MALNNNLFIFYLKKFETFKNSGKFKIFKAYWKSIQKIFQIRIIGEVSKILKILKIGFLILPLQ